MKAELIGTPEALAALEPEWWTLFSRIPAITPFSSPAWLLPWWDAFSPGALCSVAIRHEGELVGLAPLYIEDGPYGRRLLPIGIGVSDYMDVLLHPAHADLAGGCVFAALAGESSRWEVWSAEELFPEAAALGLSLPDRWQSSLHAGSACPVLPLTSEGLASNVVPSHKRRNWNLAQNRVARRSGSVRRETADTLQADLAYLFSLHAARWEGRGESGVLAPDPVQRFHETAAPRLLAAGLLRMLSLDLGDAVAGVYHGLLHRDRAYAYLTGFDPRFAFESPGTILLGSAIEAAASEGCTEFHFLRGQEPYKYGWGATDRWNACRQFRLSP